MKKYIAPSINVIKIESADVIADSLGISNSSTPVYQAPERKDSWDFDDCDDTL